MAKLSWLTSLCALILAIGCSSNPKADDPSKAGEGSGQGDPTATDPGSSTDETSVGQTSTPVAMGTVKRTDDENSVPDDYSLVERDCVDLGKKLGDLWRADLRASLSPKLNDKQREKAEQSIQEGASKKEEDWANGCIKSLVGKNVDPKVLKCAFDSKDLKTFEKCLN
ncbi:MAG: hypothetical protein U0441_04100 [Polyangiaceae bacterium]